MHMYMYACVLICMCTYIYTLRGAASLRAPFEQCQGLALRRLAERFGRIRFWVCPRQTVALLCRWAQPHSQPPVRQELLEEILPQAPQVAGDPRVQEPSSRAAP